MDTRWWKSRFTFVLKGTFLSLLILLPSAWYFKSHRIGIDPQSETCLPFRVYTIDLNDHTIQRNGYISFRMDKRGKPFFKDGQLFIKQVVGVPGDMVVVNLQGLFVNGKFIKPMNKFILKRMKERLHHKLKLKKQLTLAQGEYWGMGTHPHSYGSIYWGPIYKRQVIGNAKPLF